MKKVFAHVLQTDKNIGGILHIDPNDDPVVGQESKIYVDLKDKTGKFQLTDCECTYRISTSGNELTIGAFKGQIIYIFPEKNIYILDVQGTPSGEATFQPFSLQYTIRVSRDIQKNGGISYSIPVAFCILVAIFLFIRRKK